MGLGCPLEFVVRGMGAVKNRGADAVAELCSLFTKWGGSKNRLGLDVEQGCEHVGVLVVVSGVV